ncbi:MAG: polymorphic toxin-type HINT domain-containing protein, partial [Verrucomicrobia bacterium]|nr:polymorphic toxin-type HINT domain-containing protein [Verrucomicrobiota bacterium]
IIIGFGIHPLSGASEIELIERFRLCLQLCSCCFLHENSSEIAQSGYYLDGSREIEERNANDALIQQYVYGRYIDEPLVMDRNLDGDASATGSSDQRLFYHENRLHSVVGLTDFTGKLVEGCLYDAYGAPTVLAPGTNGLIDFGGDDVVVAGINSFLGNPYGFTGRRFDAESELCYYRERYMSPDQGRFISRDPIGYCGHALGLHEYAGGRPLKAIDPYGLAYISSRYSGRPDLPIKSEPFPWEYVGIVKGFYGYGVGMWRGAFKDAAEAVFEVVKDKAAEWVAEKGTENPESDGEATSEPRANWDINFINSDDGQEYKVTEWDDKDGHHMKFEQVNCTDPGSTTDNSSNDSSVGNDAVGGDTPPPPPADGDGYGGYGGDGGDAGGGGGCFVAGTPVIMADGTTKPIEKVAAGDRVLSRDEVTGELAAKRVWRTWVHSVPATLLLRFGENQEIETTREHRFYVINRGFVSAGHLTSGDTLRIYTGMGVRVTGTEPHKHSTTVYNLGVEPFQTYFVGEAGLWVHNMKVEGDSGGDGSDPEGWW